MASSWRPTSGRCSARRASSGVCCWCWPAAAAGGRSGVIGRRAAALTAGAIFTIVCLAYLTLWWDASTLAAGTFVWRSAWTLLPVALAAAISLLLGHLVTVTTLAVVVARSGGAGGVHGVPGSSRRVLAAAGALTFVAALLLLTFSARADHERVEAPALAVVSSGVRARLIAIDGFDAAIADGLRNRGQIPAIAALFDGAVARLDSGDTRDPARSLDDHRDRAVAGPSWRARARDTARRRRRGHAGHGRSLTARPLDRRRHRSASSDDAVDRDRHRAPGEDDVGGGGRCRAAHRRRQLVGDMARARGAPASW